MFLRKTSVIAAFKFCSIIFVMFMLCIFMRVVFVSESLNEDFNKKGIQKIHVKFSHETVVKHFCSNKFFENNEAIIIEEKENCTLTYLAYYACALILGAYVNVKRLYKMGPI
jgi:hypothetical protein